MQHACVRVFLRTFSGVPLNHVHMSTHITHTSHTHVHHQHFSYTPTVYSCMIMAFELHNSHPTPHTLTHHIGKGWAVTILGDLWGAMFLHSERLGKSADLCCNIVCMGVCGCMGVQVIKLSCLEGSPLSITK